MKKLTIALLGTCVFMAAANAQSVPGRVSGTVSGLEGTAGQATSTSGASSGSQAMSGLSNSSTLGGGLPGGYKMKFGDKVIDFRGAVGVGDDRRNFSAGVGLPF